MDHTIARRRAVVVTDVSETSPAAVAPPSEQGDVGSGHGTAQGPVSRPRHSRSVPRRPWPTRLARSLVVIVVYTVPSVVLWWHAWTIGAASSIRCDCLDPAQQVWFVAWPAFAVSHGLSPFSTTWLWPPGGVNLLSNASAPLIGLALAPVTWAFGPFAATTVALTLAPALSAWGCFLACRRLVAWRPAWWIAGLVFGYSPFVVQSVAQGHLTTGLLVFPPLIVLVLHEMLVRQQWSYWWSGTALGALVAAQFLVSPEVLVITAVMAVVTVIVSAVVAPRRAAAAAPYVLRTAGVACAVIALALGWPLWDLLAGPRHISGPLWGGLQAFLVATPYQLWNPGTYSALLVPFPDTVQGPPLEFLGFGTLVAAAASVVVARRSRKMWIVALLVLVGTVFSWGSFLSLSPGHRLSGWWLPWSWMTHLPVFYDVLPIRFPALVDLAVAILVAIGLDTARSWTIWQKVPLIVGVLLTGAVAAAAMVIPAWITYGAPLEVQRVTLPQWYATAGHFVDAGSVVVSYPFPSSASLTAEPMVWQAADGMRFRLAGGYVKIPDSQGKVLGEGPVDAATRTLDDLTLGSLVAKPSDPSAKQLAALRSALEEWGATYIVVTDTAAMPVEAAATFSAATGLLPDVAHRAWVWRLPEGSLSTTYDAAAAAGAYHSCRPRFFELGPVSGGLTLPQSFNRCIVSEIRTP
jgi:hypothetical protein